MLAVALGRYLEAHGGVIRNKPVTQLIIEGGNVQVWNALTEVLIARTRPCFPRFISSIW